MDNKETGKQLAIFGSVTLPGSLIFSWGLGSLLGLISPKLVSSFSVALAVTGWFCTPLLAFLVYEKRYGDGKPLNLIAAILFSYFASVCGLLIYSIEKLKS